MTVDVHVGLMVCAHLMSVDVLRMHERHQCEVMCNRLHAIEVRVGLHVDSDSELGSQR